MSSKGLMDGPLDDKISEKQCRYVERCTRRMSTHFKYDGADK